MAIIDSKIKIKGSTKTSWNQKQNDILQTRALLYNQDSQYLYVGKNQSLSNLRNNPVTTNRVISDSYAIIESKSNNLPELHIGVSANPYDSTFLNNNTYYGKISFDGIVKQNNILTNRSIMKLDYTSLSLHDITNASDYTEGTIIFDLKNSNIKIRNISSSYVTNISNHLILTHQVTTDNLWIAEDITLDQSAKIQIITGQTENTIFDKNGIKCIGNLNVSGNSILQDLSTNQIITTSITSTNSLTTNLTVNQIINTKDIMATGDITSNRDVTNELNIINTSTNYNWRIYKDNLGNLIFATYTE